MIEHIAIWGDGGSYEPQPCPDDLATNAKPGSAERVEAYARRVEAGVELYHEDDKYDQSADTVERIKSPYSPSHLRMADKY